MRKIKAYRVQPAKPLSIKLHIAMTMTGSAGNTGQYTKDGAALVIYQIMAEETVDTSDGRMTRLKIATTYDLACPTLDTIAYLGKIAAYSVGSKHRVISCADAHAPEIWWWRDKLWAKALNSDGIAYYHNGWSVLHELEIPEAELAKVLESVSGIRSSGSPDF